VLAETLDGASLACQHEARAGHGHESEGILQRVEVPPIVAPRDQGCVVEAEPRQDRAASTDVPDLEKAAHSVDPLRCDQSMRQSDRRFVTE
jgi:hypothetical protein